MSIRKYCQGIDCLVCGEKEPCIYKIANGLDEDLTELKQTYNACYKEHLKVVEQNKQLQARIQELETEIRQWAALYDLEKKSNLVLAQQLKIKT